MRTDPLPSAFESLLLIAEFLAAIIGGLWLIGIGEWLAVVEGVLAALFVQYPLKVLTIPTTISAKYLLKAIVEQKTFRTTLIGFAMALYLNVIYLLWVLGTFATFAVKKNDAPLLPLMLFAYAVAMSPLTYFLTGEPQQNVGTKRSLVFVQVQFLVLLGLFLNNISPIVQLQTLTAITILFSIFNTAIGSFAMKNAIMK